MVVPSVQRGQRVFWISVPQLLSLASPLPWHIRSDGCDPADTEAPQKTALNSVQLEPAGGETHLRAPYCYIVVVLVAELERKQARRQKACRANYTI